MPGTNDSSQSMSDHASENSQHQTFKVDQMLDPMFIDHGRYVDRDKTINAFETKESGYFHAMRDAYQFARERIIDSAEKLSFKLIDQIQQKTYENVESTNYEQLKKMPDYERECYGVEEGVITQKKLTDGYFGAMKFSDEGIAFVRQMSDNVKIMKNQTKNYVHNEHMDMIINNNSYRFLRELDEDDLNKMMEEAIQRFNQTVSTVDGKQKEKAIFDLCKTLELIHPYRDCNCRTFVMILQNVLRQKHGLEPIIQSNPNLIDNLGYDEYMQTVITRDQYQKDIKIASKQLHEIHQQAMSKQMGAQDILIRDGVVHDKERLLKVEDSSSLFNHSEAESNYNPGSVNTMKSQYSNDQGDVLSIHTTKSEYFDDDNDIFNKTIESVDLTNNNADQGMPMLFNTPKECEFILLSKK
ncbi:MULTISPECIES: hypothetical protein [Cysteiniphilum]|nr:MULTISPECIES: hypothetical protein [Cysteiniphilum]